MGFEFKKENQIQSLNLCLWRLLIRGVLVTHENGPTMNLNDSTVLLRLTDSQIGQSLDPVCKIFLFTILITQKWKYIYEIRH